MTEMEQYIANSIRAGDTGSSLLAARAAPTLRRQRVKILRAGLSEIAVLETHGKYVVVHSACGDPAEKNPKFHAESLVDSLVRKARIIGAEPTAFASVIGSQTGDIQKLEEIAEGLVGKAKKHNLAILSIENTTLGTDILDVAANVSGTMISLSDMPLKSGNDFAVFDPQGRPVYMNSTGVGTKMALYALTDNFHRALYDSVALKADDAAGIGANVMVMMDMMGTSGDIGIERMILQAEILGEKVSAQYILTEQKMPTRLRNNMGESACIISGTAVSTVDENVMRSLVPKPADSVLAVQGKPNPRSSGMGVRMQIAENMGKLFRFTEGVSKWYETVEGEKFLDYATQPSPILYRVYRELIGANAATGIFPMGSGAFDKSVARPFAAHNLFVMLENMFPPNETDVRMLEFSRMDTEKAYAQWSMGNDGFVTTDKFAQAVAIIQRYGLDVRKVGRLERAQGGKTGVGLRAYNGREVYFSGK